MLHHVGIVGTGSYVPEKVLTNADLEKIVDTNNEWIVSRTGIKERHIAEPETPVSELCRKAAQKALEDANVAPEEVELIIVCTVTPDYAFPATAGLVADMIGAKHAAGFDLSAGCSGFLYGMTTAAQFIATGVYKTALVIGAETLSKLINWEDRSTCVLFGDGAGAAVLQPVEEGYGFLGYDLGADGSGGHLLTCLGGGSKNPASLETVQNKLHTIRMAGSEVFKFAVRIMGEASFKALDRAGLKKEDIDFFVPHQANVRIIDSAVKRLGVDPEKVIINLDRYGNTSSASIPLALDEASRSGKINYGDNVLMVGFGAGLTWGAAVLKWAKRK
ncbi:beta-ketoacyl-ACP synthase III [Desulfitobacterium sp. Sab5]|uniref:beta-ketoacyl-ACP synthase III n=1 Tax=Desulfitobacterium TaxID=36853 RepID=UPI003CE6734A